MFRTHIYLTEEQEREIKIRATITKKPKAEIVRELIDEGLKTSATPRSSSAQALLDLAMLAREIPTKPGAPTDVSENLDYYTWGGKKET